MVEALYTGGMTDQQIATATGISQASITRIRNGKQADPKYATWSAISELYLQKQAEAAVTSGAGQGGHAAP
jgi:predicted transcriptional regulator